MMKGNNQIFHNNFPEDKMTESIKLANYRGSAHESHLQHFEKYAAGGGNEDNNDQIEDREDKISPHDGIDIAAHTRQIKTEYSQVSHYESGFQKSKTIQAEMLKQLRSEYDHLKNLPLDRQEERAPSSNSNSQRQGTSEVASSIPSSKHRKRNKEVERDRDYKQRDERIWLVEKKQYESIVASCQAKIQQLLHAEMGYKRTIHELRSSIVTSKPSSQNNKAEQLMIKELQNSLREEKQKNKYLEKELQKSKSFSKQQNEKLSRVEGQFSSRTRQIHQYEEDKRKFQDLARLERQKFQNSEIEKRKYQMEYEILKKDKQLQNIRLVRLNDHEKVVAEMNLKKEIKKFQEEIQLKDRRYQLLLEEYERLKRHTHEKKDKKETHNTFQMFEDIKNLIQQNRNAQNEQFSKTMNILISKMEEENSEVESSNNFDLENERLKAQIKIMKAQIEFLHNRDHGDSEAEHLKHFYENQIIALKDVIDLLEKKLKEKQQIQTPLIPFPPQNNSSGDSSALKIRINELEMALSQTQSIASENQKTYLMYKGKWEQDQNQLRSLKRRLDEVTFQLEKCSKQFQFQSNMMRTETETNIRILRTDLDKANSNVAYWQKEFENMKKFYQARIEQKNRLIQQSSNNTLSVEEVKKQYDRNFDIVKAQYERQIASLTEKVSDHPSYSIQYEQLRRKHTQLEMMYFDLKNNSRKSWQINQGIDHLWGIKETQYGNVNEILRQVKARPIVNYTTTTYNSKPQYRHSQAQVQADYRSNRQSAHIMAEQPAYIIRKSQSSGIANRNSGYQPALGSNRQTVYSIRESGSGYGAMRQSGPMDQRSGYAESGYPGGIRMSSAYEDPRQRVSYVQDGYIRESEEQYQDERQPDQYEGQYQIPQGGFVRESGYGLARSSGRQGYYANQPIAYDERASQGFRIRQSSGYGGDPVPDYRSRESRPYQISNSGPYDMNYDIRQSHSNRQSQTPGFVDERRISNSYYSGVRDSGYGGNSVYDGYQGQREQPVMVRV